jgi:hypothetical protein
MAFFQRFGSTISAEEVNGLVEMVLSYKKIDVQSLNALAALVSSLSEDHIQSHFALLFRASLDYSEEAISLAARIARFSTPEVISKVFIQVCDEQLTLNIDEAEYPRFPHLLALVGVLEYGVGSHAEFAANHLWTTISKMSELNQSWFIDDVARRFDGVGELLFVREFRNQRLKVKVALRLLLRMREPVVSEFVPEVIAWLDGSTQGHQVNVEEDFIGSLARAAANAGAWHAAVVIHCRSRLAQENAQRHARSVYEELKGLHSPVDASQILITLLPIAPDSFREELLGDLEDSAYANLRQHDKLKSKLEMLTKLLPYLSPRTVKRLLRETVSSFRKERDHRKYSRIDVTDLFWITMADFLEQLAQRTTPRIVQTLSRALPAHLLPLFYKIQLINELPDDAPPESDLGQQVQITPASDSDVWGDKPACYGKADEHLELDVFFKATNNSRKELLNEIARCLPRIYQIGGPLAVERIAVSLEEIMVWWP